MTAYKKTLAEQLHIWYLEATAHMSVGFNPEAQKSFSELSDNQKYIDKYIAEKVNRMIDQEKLDLLDEVTRRWNSYIGDMPDKEKEKLGYLELTGMVWGIVAQFRIPLLSQLNNTEQETE